MKKPTHERSPDRRSDANLSRGIYRPLDQRAVRDEPVLSRIFRRQFGPHLVNEGKLKPAKKIKSAGYDLRDEDVKAYGQRDYERMHET